MTTTIITTPKIYVSVLTDYNSGILHGAWIDADQSVEELWQAVHQLYITSNYPNVSATVCNECGHIKLYDHSECSQCSSKDVKNVPSAEEYAIHDYEGFAPFNVSEYDSMEDLAQMAEILSNDSDPEHHALSFLVERGLSLDDIESKLEDVCIFDGSRSDYAEEITEQIGAEIPQYLMYYIDYDKMGRDMEINGEITELERNVFCVNCQEL